MNDLLLSANCRAGRHGACENSQCLCDCHDGGSKVREPRRPLPPDPLEGELELVQP